MPVHRLERESRFLVIGATLDPGVAASVVGECPVHKPRTQN